MEKILYIHIEGMDLAGKTEQAKKLADKVGGRWEIRRNSMSAKNEIYPMINALRKSEAYDASTFGNLYVAVLMEDIRTFTQPTVNTIQDSTILLRSLAHHSIRRTPRVIDALLRLLSDHPQFDASFVLTANLEARLQRLRRRISQAPEQIASIERSLIENPTMFYEMEAYLVDYARKIFHSTVIDTSLLSSEEVTQTIFNRLSNEFPKFVLPTVELRTPARA